MTRTAIGFVFAVALTAAEAMARPVAPPLRAEVAAHLGDLSFADADPAVVVARCAATEALAGRLEAALLVRSGDASIDGDFALYDTLTGLLTDVGSEAQLVAEAAPAQSARSAGRACMGRLETVSARIATSRAMYDRLAAVPLLTPQERHVVGRVLLRYRLAGVGTDAATRARVAELQAEIAATVTEFQRNISEDARPIVLSGPAALVGLPADFIAAHPPERDGKVRLSTRAGDVGPALGFADDPETRRALYVAAFNTGWPANDVVLARLFRLRAELAQRLGYKDYATLDLAGRMAGTPARARALLDEVGADARAAEAADNDRLLAMARRSDPAATLKPADIPYLTRLVRKRDLDVDGAEVRRYFTLAKAQAGIFGVARDLFGADIRPWQTPVWAPGVTAWALYDGKRLIGRFYLDLSPRDGKFALARASWLRGGVKDRDLPLAALLCNFPAGGNLGHGEVITFFHEFGHLLHLLYGGSQRFAAAAPANLEGDALEAPSQMLEAWAWDPVTLARFATDSDGKPIPPALVARLKAARNFGLGRDWTTNIGYSAVALGFHERPPGFDLKTVYDELRVPYTLVPDGPDTHRYAAFLHLGIYAAGYYGYVWSKAIAYDLDAVFKRAPADRPIAARYRDNVIGRGASLPAANLFHDFLGRDWTTAAFRADLRRHAAFVGADSPAQAVISSNMADRPTR